MLIDEIDVIRLLKLNLISILILSFGGKDRHTKQISNKKATTPKHYFYFIQLYKHRIEDKTIFREYNLTSNILSLVEKESFLYPF